MPRACSGNMLLEAWSVFSCCWQCGNHICPKPRTPKDQSHIYSYQKWIGFNNPAREGSSWGLPHCVCVCHVWLVLVNFLHVPFLEDEQYYQSISKQFTAYQSLLFQFFSVSRGGATFFDDHASSCSPLESKTKTY